MQSGQQPHTAVVTAWIARTAPNLSTKELIRLFDHALRSLWQRANSTISEVTLGAVMERVLVTSVERFPLLSPLTVGIDGVQMNALGEVTPTATAEEITQAFQSLLVDFLTVMANLTEDIMTPALHSTLNKVVLSPRSVQSKSKREEEQ